MNERRTFAKTQAGPRLQQAHEYVPWAPGGKSDRRVLATCIRGWTTLVVSCRKRPGFLWKCRDIGPSSRPHASGNEVVARRGSACRGMTAPPCGKIAPARGCLRYRRQGSGRLRTFCCRALLPCGRSVRLMPIVWHETSRCWKPSDLGPAKARVRVFSFFVDAELRLYPDGFAPVASATEAQGPRSHFPALPGRSIRFVQTRACSRSGYSCQVFFLTAVRDLAQPEPFRRSVSPIGGVGTGGKRGMHDVQGWQDLQDHHRWGTGRRIASRGHCCVASFR